MLTFCIQEIFKTNVYKVFFWVQNYHLNLCSSVVNLLRLLCSQKAGVKCPFNLSSIQNLL